jgi:hypothetical protein
MSALRLLGGTTVRWVPRKEIVREPRRRRTPKGMTVKEALLRLLKTKSLHRISEPPDIFATPLLN